MADPRPWLKFWKCWVSDPDIRGLSWADKGRWAELFLLVGEHGHDGAWMLRRGVADLPESWRRGRTPTQTLEDLRRLPGFRVEICALEYEKPPRGPEVRRTLVTPKVTGLPPAPLPSQALQVSMSNWHKYQVDHSTPRVQRWRASHVSRNGQPGQPRNGSREDKKREDPPTPHSALDQKSLERHRRELQATLADEHPEWSSRRVEDETFAEMVRQGLLPAPEPQPTPDEPPPF